MYTLKETETQGLHYLEMASSDGESKAQLCLDQGGRLSNFVFEKIQILADLDTSTYKDNYASSILFPFANRIKDGEYTFNDSKYKLDCNEVDKNNALHGLVYNKTFVCIHKVTTADYACVTLQYKDGGKHKGFPFKFNIELTYTLSKSGIILSITIVNKSKKTFPFTLGWHPYFNSVNLDNSSINFKSTKKYVLDSQQIISGETDLDFEMPLQLKGTKLDDGYPLETNEIDFSTPAYCFNIRSSAKENFLQLYTPPQPNIIAIEPMTGAADNFNNKIGLQTLQPNETYTVKWSMAIQTLDTKLKTNQLINKLCSS
ncbi:Aldose 1-epimerase [Kordia antarctica]|uniref:Aldose 1-epimerase n=1 Tax=Kordia antarctica TaxID=1218801 RepID=A0A7L4ZR75_9FLAO|nr:aldose 1-epimerase [Kordia antarctica]QHI39213.1 Aldose 1-epimerase [Kordia antarctica]